MMLLAKRQIFLIQKTTGINCFSLIAPKVKALNFMFKILCQSVFDPTLGLRALLIMKIRSLGRIKISKYLVSEFLVLLSNWYHTALVS